MIVIINFILSFFDEINIVRLKCNLSKICLYVYVGWVIYLDFKKKISFVFYRIVYKMI